MGWQEKAAKAKKGHRPSLSNWERDGLASTFPPYAEELLNSTHPYRSFTIESISGEEEAVVVERCLSLEHVRGDAVATPTGMDHGDDRGNDLSVHLGSSDHGTMYPVVLDAAHTPPKVFHDRYEARCIPVVIRNIPYGASSGDSDGVTAYRLDCDDVGDDRMEEEEKKECDLGHRSNCRSSQVNKKEWPAIHRWTLNALYTDRDLSSRPLKCGEDDDGYTIRMKLKYFLDYLHHNRDDSPLYIFDATFDEDKYAKRILKDYTVPEYFDEDFLHLVGERRRPPYRWFLVGPCRSGTTVHVDPLGTSAWNTLIHGVKRWALFPPHVPKSVVKGRRIVLPGEDDEAIHYFTTILPRMKRRAASSGGKGDYANFTCYEFTQYAGETVFVPHGWWHAVLNVTHTVGITQNYCSRRNFDEVWRQTRSGRKKMSCSWLRRLDERCPDLAERARELNQLDGFVMWEDDPVEQSKWRKKKAEREHKKNERREKRKKMKEELKMKEKWGVHRRVGRKKDGVVD